MSADEGIRQLAQLQVDVERFAAAIAPVVDQANQSLNRDMETLAARYEQALKEARHDR